MRKIVLIFLILNSLNSYSHKNKLWVEEKDNVQMITTSSWDYSEMYKTKVIVELANKLSKELNFKEIIFIQYHIKKVKYLNKTYSIDFKKSNEFGKHLSINVVDENIDIIEFLKLIEFSINNRDHLNKVHDKIKIFSDGTIENLEDFNHFKKQKIFNSQILKGIYSSETSNFIQELVKSEIEILEENEFVVKWEKSFFKILKSNNELIKVSDNELHSVQFINEGAIVFPNYKGFYFIDNNSKFSSFHKLECKYFMYYFLKEYSAYKISYYYNINKPFYFIPSKDLITTDLN